MLRLVPLALEHVPLIMSWVNDREVTQYFAALQADVSEPEERRFVEALAASADDRAFSIFDGDEYLGQCSVNKIYWPARNGRVFIALRRAAQGRGHGRAALARLMEIAWGELDLHKLWLIVRRDNHRAQALYVRLGFEFEGVLRDEYSVGGRYLDMVRMAALRPVSQLGPGASVPGYAKN